MKKKTSMLHLLADALVLKYQKVNRLNRVLDPATEIMSLNL